MKCPFCGGVDDRVVDSRESREGQVIRRRRECTTCGRRFTSYETIEEIPYVVVKKDGRREPFDRKKLRAGLVKACEKRPVAAGRLDAIVDEIEMRLHDSEERENRDELGHFHSFVSGLMVSGRRLARPACPTAGMR